MGQGSRSRVYKKLFHEDLELFGYDPVWPRSVAKTTVLCKIPLGGSLKFALRANFVFWAAVVFKDEPLGPFL